MKTATDEYIKDIITSPQYTLADLKIGDTYEYFPYSYDYKTKGTLSCYTSDEAVMLDAATNVYHVIHTIES